jgi:hypothetical protein
MFRLPPCGCVTLLPPSQEFLRARGISLHSPSVIRQPFVTHLADTNSPQEIAKVVADASGLAR